MGCPSTRTVHACTYLQPCGIAPLHQVSQPIHTQLLTMETPTTCASLALSPPSLFLPGVEFCRGGPQHPHRIWRH
jgi:hypothetical protein